MTQLAMVRCGKFPTGGFLAAGTVGGSAAHFPVTRYTTWTSPGWTRTGTTSSSSAIVMQ